jgi:hypothetical protein
MIPNNPNTGSVFPSDDPVLVPRQEVSLFFPGEICAIFILESYPELGRVRGIINEH